jgi:hypothetical protein
VGETEFVKVTPVEYDRKRGRVIRYYRKNGRYFEKFDVGAFKLFLGGLNLKKEPEIIVNPGHLVFYQYPDKPLIVMDLDAGCFLTTEGTVEHFGWKKVRHQASILLRLLKKFGASQSKRKAIRYGKSREKAETYKAYLEWEQKNSWLRAKMMGVL